MISALSIWRFSDSPARDSEAQLLFKARRGDREALDALYRRHAGAAYTLALQICGDADRANDVVQDAFLRAFDRLDALRDAAQFRAWLKRIVATVAVDHVRRDRRLVFSDELIEQADPHTVRAAEQLDAVGLLARLSTASRTVLVLYELEGYSHQEISDLLGRSEAWSKTVLSRARSCLAAWVD